MDMEKRLYHLYLAELACAMPQSVRNLLNEYGSAERIWTLTEAEIDRIFYLKETQKAEMKLAKTRGLPKRQLEEMEKKEIGAVCIEEEDYPERLRQLTDAPYMLFYKGRLPAEEIRMVAVIGARRCSDYGRRAADYFGRELAKAGVPVISGLAVGLCGRRRRKLWGVGIGGGHCLSGREPAAVSDHTGKRRCVERVSARDAGCGMAFSAA